MIIFQYKDEKYTIDDNFTVQGGEYKEAFQKDLDAFLMDVSPSSGDVVEQYSERLKTIIGANVYLAESKKYPLGTVDVSDYEED